MRCLCSSLQGAQGNAREARPHGSVASGQWIVVSDQWLVATEGGAKPPGHPPQSSDSSTRNLVDLSLRYFRRRGRRNNTRDGPHCAVCAALPSMGRALLPQRPNFQYLCLAICLRRDADGGGRDDRALQKVANDPRHKPSQTGRGLTTERANPERNTHVNIDSAANLGHPLSKFNHWRTLRWSDDGPIQPDPTGSNQIQPNPT